MDFKHFSFLEQNIKKQKGAVALRSAKKAKDRVARKGCPVSAFIV